MGKRGEGWVVLQFILFALIILAPPVEGFEFPPWLRVPGWLLMAAGGLFSLAGLVGLGTNLTPFPKPKEGGHLVTAGAYGLVRHPIYAGLILAAFGWALARGSMPGFILALGLFVFFDVKSRREEAWLMQSYLEYAAYRRRVKKLIPWLY